MPSLVESRPESTARFVREPAKPRLAEAPPPGAVSVVDSELSELLGRLERQAAESGRLEGRVDALEAALRKQRDARRRLAETVRRERRAAHALKERAERAEEAHAQSKGEAERLREAAAVTEQHLHIAWARVGDLEESLAWQSRPIWRKALRRPPAG
jgi:predicted RNase H-like nuclease (RuvC/YqgF family)